jgi:hypothetical protein
VNKDLGGLKKEAIAAYLKELSQLLFGETEEK